MNWRLLVRSTAIFVVLFSLIFLVLMIVRGHSWFSPLEDGTVFTALVFTLIVSTAWRWQLHYLADK